MLLKSFQFTRICVGIVVTLCIWVRQAGDNQNSQVTSFDDVTHDQYVNTLDDVRYLFNKQIRNSRSPLLSEFNDDYFLC